MDSTYLDQILEARLAGADSVLLIVKMLEDSQLRRLYNYSRQLGMEPLVEVNTIEEMTIATRLGALVIGVNNRNLTNFEVDLDTTTRLMDMKGANTIIAALSGISGHKDVTAYAKSGVNAILVGEALMRAENTAAFVEDLLGAPRTVQKRPTKTDVLVKICGTRTPEAARVAIEAGADMVGIILVEGRKRCVGTDAALAISKVVHEIRKSPVKEAVRAVSDVSAGAIEFFEHTSSFFQNADKALLVGVFQNQPLEYILAQQKLLSLDVIQLHGSEPIEWASLIPIPVFHRFGAGDPGLGTRGYHALPLLDSAKGGTGQKQDPTAIYDLMASDPSLRFIFAGGLDPVNVGQTVKQLRHRGPGLVAVDVSSGVEENGVQDVEKIKSFIVAAKGNKEN